jgi:hypothetical protein
VRELTRGPLLGCAGEFLHSHEGANKAKLEFYLRQVATDQGFDFQRLSWLYPVSPSATGDWK